VRTDRRFKTSDAVGAAILVLAAWQAAAFWGGYCDSGEAEQFLWFGLMLFAAMGGVLLLGTRSTSRTLSYLLLTALAIFLIAPFAWMVLISLHPPKTPIPPLAEVVPKAPAWSNYQFVLFHPNLPVAGFFFNSFFVTAAVVVGQLLVTSMAAYGFARLRFRGREALFAMFLGSMMFAGPVTQIPVYLLLRNLGWLDTYWALIVPGVSSAFSVFLLRQFFMQIPKELDEAARIDGAGDFRIYWRVILPLSKAALATCAAFTFIGVWTDFFGPLIYTNTTEMRTLEVGLSIFKNSYGGTNWPLQMTAAVIVMLPLLAVFLMTQRYFVKGITMGSIK
jgi:multiple sugar transport system permease protein